MKTYIRTDQHQNGVSAREAAVRLGLNLAGAREAARMSQAQLGLAIGRSPNTISRWERGLSLPAALTLARMAETLAVSVDDLLSARVQRRAPIGEHLRFAALEALLPDTGSPEADKLAHVLACPRCTDAALAILQRTSKLSTKVYEQAFERAVAKAAEVAKWFQDDRERAAAFAVELAALTPRRQEARVRELSRLRPWEVAGALLGHARRILTRSPGLAKRLAFLAGLALAAIEPQSDPDQLAEGLRIERICLLAEAALQGGKAGEAEAALSAAVFSDSRPQDRAAYCLTLAMVRRAQGRLDEDLALLRRAAHLYAVAGDGGGEVEALAMAEEVEALLQAQRTSG